MKRLYFNIFLKINFISFVSTEFLFLTLSYNIMNDNDIEGEEDGISGMDGEVKVN